MSNVRRMQKPALHSEWFVGMAFLALAVGTHFFFGAHALVRLVGIACVFTGLFWIFRRRIPVGWEGQPPSFHLTGLAAVASGIAMVALGVVLVLYAPVAACVLGWSVASAC